MKALAMMEALAMMKALAMMEALAMFSRSRILFRGDEGQHQRAVVVFQQELVEAGGRAPQSHPGPGAGGWEVPSLPVPADFALCDSPRRSG